MYDWNDILIVGDSFCGDRDKDYHWPVIFSRNITGILKINPRGKGFGGAAWWSTRKNLIKELSLMPAKVLVICHTEANRIPSDYDYSLNYSNAQHQNSIKPKDPLFHAAVKYYTHLYSEEFHIWSQKRWFIQLDNYLSKMKIEKIIHLHCFPPKDRKPYIFQNGVTVDRFLYDYWGQNSSDDPNHMSIELNWKFANYLTEIINNYQGDGVCIPGMTY
jgi:hypothetical protein